MEQSTSDCSSYVINVPPVTGCEGVVVSRNYNFRIYNSNGVLVHDVGEALDGTLFCLPTKWALYNCRNAHDGR